MHGTPFLNACWGGRGSPDVEDSSDLEERIAQWRATGETAERFSRGRGFAGQTLKWWAWRLARESDEAPVIRVAQVVRAWPGEPEQVGGAIVVEYLDRRVRVRVGRGAEEWLAAAVIGQFEGGAK